MIKKRLILSLVLVSLTSGCLLSSCSRKQSQTQKQQNSMPKVVNSASIPTYVFYFAKWCKFCKQMAPAVKKAAKDFKNEIHFHYVDMDSEEGKKFSQKYRPNGRGVPFAQYYDAKGIFVKDKIGAIGEQELNSSLNALLIK